VVLLSAVTLQVPYSGKVHLITGHKGLSLTSALDGVGSQRHAPAALPPGKDQYPFCGRLGGPQGRS
jgi:hypothetical protein